MSQWILAVISNRRVIAGLAIGLAVTAVLLIPGAHVKAGSVCYGNCTGSPPCNSIPLTFSIFGYHPASAVALQFTPNIQSSCSQFVVTHIHADLATTSGTTQRLFELAPGTCSAPGSDIYQRILIGNSTVKDSFQANFDAPGTANNPLPGFVLGGYNTVWCARIATGSNGPDLADINIVGYDIP